MDPATEIKEKCAEDHCAKYKDRLDECNARVSSLTFNLADGSSELLSLVISFGKSKDGEIRPTAQGVLKKLSTVEIFLTSATYSNIWTKMNSSSIK